jgi:hypothetical protein
MIIETINFGITLEDYYAPHVLEVGILFYFC